MLIGGKKDRVFLEFKELDLLKNRQAQGRFVVEDALLVGRAVDDGLAVEKVIYTDRYGRRDKGVDCYKINDGLLAALTSTRPLPAALAIVKGVEKSVDELEINGNSAYVITDCVSNPDNLGMILRTADAAGIGGAAVLGDGASVYHKNCIRAARGAMGRLPIITGDDTEILERLKRRGVALIGAGADAAKSVYDLRFDSPAAFIVGNENHGIRREIMAYCDETVHIPMLPGRDSLSVAVAASILIYEWVRKGVEQNV